MNFSPPEIERFTVLVLGSFNPSILQPAWFASEKLLRKGETESAKNLIVSNDYTAFSLEWMTLQVRTNRLDVFSEDVGSFDLVRDLVLGMFRLLSHTPVTSLQLLNHRHFRANSIDEWHQVGNTLAPKEIYKDILKKPGMLMLQLQDERADEREGGIIVDFEPSQRITPGVYAAVGDTYKLTELSKKDALGGARLLMEILTHDWSSSMSRRQGMMMNILERI